MFVLYFDVGGLIPGEVGAPVLLAPLPEGAVVVELFALLPLGGAVEVVPVEFEVTVVLLLAVLSLPPQPVQNAATASRARTPKALRIFLSCH